jgi:Fic family protein
MSSLPPISQFDPARCETQAVLRRLASSGRRLAELKGMATAIPHQGALINTLTLQEAKDSSEIENIITTHDDLFRGEACSGKLTNPATREVLRCRQALLVGLERVRATGLLTVNHITEIQAELEQNSAGFRTLPGTVIKDGAGRTVYSPPQDPAEIIALMRDLENFINAPGPDHANLDPLIRMALIHHQFESIHPFYDGNGRIGRVLNVLYLVKEGLLDIPALRLSRFIVLH